jgi:hypothetical protein
MSDYNYPHFTSAHYDASRFDGPSPGEPMPEGRVFRPSGEELLLSALPRPYVLEMGSLTCPIFVSGLGRMNQLALLHPEVHFFVLYVREAHPGERRPPHADLADKLRASAQLTRAEPERREVLIDDVEGTLHRALGAWPNSVYLVGREGLVSWRSDWGAPEALNAVLRGEADARTLAVERRAAAHPEKAAMLRALRRGGVAAFEDMQADPSEGGWIFGDEAGARRGDGRG